MLKKTSDLEIVTLLLRKDTRGMDVLFDNYGNYIFGLIFKIVKQEDVAEHVLQDTFLKAWTKIDCFNVTKGRFSTWLINIARNTAIDMIRSKNYKQSLKLISLDQLPASKEKTTFLVVENLDIRDIVAKLGEKYRPIIELIYFEGFTHIEVAKELNLPLGTVKSRVRKAFKDLKIVLER